MSKYTDGSEGIKVTLELTVIDKPTWTAMGRKTFVGKDPPLVSLGSKSDVIGTPPDRQEVITCLSGPGGNAVASIFAILPSNQRRAAL